MGKITNLASRGAQMLNKSCGGRLGAIDPDSRALLQACRDQLPELCEAYERRDFCRAMVLVREWADKANQLFDAKMPWKLVKEDPDATRDVLTGTLNLFRLMAIALKPVLPAYAAKVEALFGEAPYAFADAARDLEDRPIAPYEHLAARIDPKAVEAMVAETKAQSAAKPAPKLSEQDIKKGVRQLAHAPAKDVFPEPPADTVSIDDFAKLDLRLATVLAAEPVPESDKLLRLTLDVGEAKPRTVFAGIKKHCPPETLPGAQVVMVANLAPRKMRFGVSEGMVLAAQGPDGALALLRPSAPLPNGARLH